MSKSDLATMLDIVALDAADAEAYAMADRMGIVPQVQLLHAEPLAPGELAAAYDTASDAREAFLLASEAFQELLPRYRRREEEPT